MKRIILNLAYIFLIVYAVNSSVLAEQNDENNEEMRNVHYTIPEPNEYLEALHTTYGTQWKYRAPSVHLWWNRKNTSEMKQVTHYYTQVTVLNSNKYSYFCTNGFHVGYAGIQQRGSDKIAIFSVWDNAGKAELVYKGKDTTASHFGGEGTGVKTTLPFNWNTYDASHILLQSEPYNGKTLFTAWFYREDLKAWYKHASIAATLKNPSPYLSGWYSFLEDWAGTGEHRAALYGPTWIKTASGDWRQADVAGASTTNKYAKNIKSFAVGEQAGWSTGGPDLPNYAIQKLNLDTSPFPCILKEVPGIQIDSSYTGHCKN